MPIREELSGLETNKIGTQQPPSPKEEDVMPAPDNASEEVDICLVIRRASTSTMSTISTFPLSSL
jgi:hypothetical protein